MHLFTPGIVYGPAAPLPDEPGDGFALPFVDEVDFHTTPVRRLADGTIVGGIPYTTTRRRRVPTEAEATAALHALVADVHAHPERYADLLALARRQRSRP